MRAISMETQESDHIVPASSNLGADPAERQRQAREAWREFVSGLTPDGSFNPLIIESWKRSRASDVDPSPEVVTFRKLEPADVERRVAARKHLIDVATPHLKRASAIMGQRAHVVYIADEDGIILYSTGSLDQMETLGLTPGFDWSEATMGTNGAGTAIAADQPVAVMGAEHYNEKFHGYCCTGAPLHGPDGEVIGAIDISSALDDVHTWQLGLIAHVAYVIEQQYHVQRNYQQALTAEREHLAAIVEASQDAIFSTTAEGKIKSWNAAAEQMYGYTAAAVLDQPVDELLAAEHVGAIAKLLDVIDSGRRCEPVEMRHVRSDGTSFPVLLVVSPMRAGTNAARAAFIVRDLTHEQQAREAMREMGAAVTSAQQEERHRLARALHDDLQQLLVAAKLRASALTRSSGGSDGDGAAAGLVSVIDDAIACSRNLASDLTPSLVLEEGLTAALGRLVNAMSRQHRLQVEAEIVLSREPRQEAVRLLVFEAVRELLFNVVKHAKTQRARLRVGDEDGHVVAEVADDGEGFDPAVVKQAGSGTGLGLPSIAQRIEMFDGSVDIESAPGRGVRVCVRAPLN